MIALSNGKLYFTPLPHPFRVRDAFNSCPISILTGFLLFILHTLLGFSITPFNVFDAQCLQWTLESRISLR